MPASLAKSRQTLQIIDRARRNVAAIVVFCGAEGEDVLIRHRAMTYTFSPGENEVRDVFGVNKEEARKAAKEKKFGPAAAHLEKNELIVAGVVLAAHAEARGNGVLAILTGDTKTDAGLKAKARETWIKQKAVRMRAITERYRTRTLAFHQDPRNKGAQAPPMTDDEVLAEKWLVRYEGGLLAIKKYPCPFNCGFHDDDKDEVQLHVRVRHAGQTPEKPPVGADGGDTDDEDEDDEGKPAARRGGKPKKAAAPAAS